MKVIDYIIKIECSDKGRICSFYPTIGTGWATTNIYKAKVYTSKEKAENAIISYRKYWTRDLEDNYDVKFIGAKLVKRTIEYEDVL